MANELAAWLAPLGAGCHAVSKNWAFWRLLTLNQFSLVTGMGLTVVCACVYAVHAHMCMCEVGEQVKERLCVCVCVFVLSQHPLLSGLINVA